MSSIFILAASAVGALCFLAAFIMAWQSIPLMRKTMIYWITFAFAMLIGFAWSVSLLFAQLGIGVAVLQTWQQPLLAVGVSELVLNAILAYAAQARPFE